MSDQEQQAVTHAELRDSLDRAVEAIALNVSERLADLRDELTRRLEGTSIRLDRIDTRLAAIELQNSGIQKWMASTERLQSQTLGTQSAQQRVIDDLAARVAKLEREIHRDQH